MAFGFSPKYVQDFQLENLTPQQFLILAIEAAKKLNWNIGFESETGFIAYTKFSVSSWSEEVKVNIENDYATLKSECTGNQIIDWGKNKRNIADLINEIELIKSSVNPEELARMYEVLKETLVPKNKIC